MQTDKESSVAELTRRAESFQACVHDLQSVDRSLPYNHNVLQSQYCASCECLPKGDAGIVHSLRRNHACFQDAVGLTVGW